MKSVLAFGDSVLKGIVNLDGRYEITEASFPRLCGERLDIQIINKARMGSTVTKGLQVFERFRKAAAETTGDTVILEFGGNDCDYDWPEVAENPTGNLEPRTPLADFKAAYRKLIAEVKAIGKQPLLLSLPPIDSHRYFHWLTRNLNPKAILEFLGGEETFLGQWHEVYNLAVFQIAAESGVEIIDISSCFLKTRNYNDFLCIDGIHPNERGHALIADTVCRYFV